MKTAMVVSGLSIALGLAAGVGLTTAHYEKKLDKLKVTLSEYKAANTDFKDSVANQNNKILGLRIAANKRAEEYAELLKKPETIRYIELESDNCEDIKRVLDDIRSNGF